MTFKIGDPKPAGSGRKRGQLMQRTIDTREVLHIAFNRIGGVDRLEQWIKEDPRNEFAFFTSMWPRLLPVRIEGQGPRGEIELNVKISAEELPERLSQRGLPPMVFGFDKPVLELQATKGNGADRDGNGSTEM